MLEQDRKGRNMLRMRVFAQVALASLMLFQPLISVALGPIIPQDVIDANIKATQKHLDTLKSQKAMAAQPSRYVVGLEERVNGFALHYRHAVNYKHGAVYLVFLSSIAATVMIGNASDEGSRKDGLTLIAIGGGVGIILTLLGLTEERKASRSIDGR